MFYLFLDNSFSYLTRIVSAPNSIIQICSDMFYIVTQENDSKRPWHLFQVDTFFFTVNQYNYFIYM